MSLKRFWSMAVVALAACVSTGPKPPPAQPEDLPTKGFGDPPDVRSDVYAPVDRSAALPTGYGLYSVVLSRSADRATAKLLSELFGSSLALSEAVIPRQNLNLITIPVKNATDAKKALQGARATPEASAATLLQKQYDYGQAALLMSVVCRPERGPAVMRACGSTTAPTGPLLVTTQRPLDGQTTSGQAVLIVNLSSTPPEALREVLAEYRRQISSKDFAGSGELDSWRLRVLNHILDLAKLLPELSKAYAAGK